MQIDKQQIMDMLKSQIPGGQDHADQAEQQLPQQVDTDNQHQLLQKFGINLQDLIQSFHWRHSRDVALRTRIKRLTRKTICFSKSELMHDLVGMFINRYEFGLPSRSNPADLRHYQAPLSDRVFSFWVVLQNSGRW